MLCELSGFLTNVVNMELVRVCTCLCEYLTLETKTTRVNFLWQTWKVLFIQLEPVQLHL